MSILTILALVAVAAANLGVGPASWGSLYQPAPPKELR
ncbi:MAG: AgrD family cyclic lactone autoinducer peptide [Eubacteriales bacterium]